MTLVLATLNFYDLLHVVIASVIASIVVVTLFSLLIWSTGQIAESRRNRNSTAVSCFVVSALVVSAALIACIAFAVEQMFTHSH